jgi:protein-tyrosine phosphatase
MGNICRSPIAEGVFRKMVTVANLDNIIHTDSAGTHANHIVGKPPDTRSQITALRRGVDLSCIRSREIQSEDFCKFDYVLAMDLHNLQHLLALCQTPAFRDRIQLLMEYAPDISEREVPDPYYGGQDGFEHVINLIEVAVEKLLFSIRERYKI